MTHNQVLVYLLPLFPKWSYVTVQLLIHKFQMKGRSEKCRLKEKYRGKTAWGLTGNMFFIESYLIKE